MAYPRKLLSQDETAHLELHPHWKALVAPVFVLLVTVPLASFLTARVPEGSAQTLSRVVVLGVAAIILVWATVLPFLRWISTHYVVTDRRIITRTGIIARSGRDMPLSRVNDISFSHTVWERVLGCGTLIVESAGETGQLMLTSVPHVEDVQRRIYELADVTMDRDDRPRPRADVDRDADGSPDGDRA